MIKAQIEDTTSDFDREKLQERLAKLSGGVAVLKVGAATEVELKEKKHRIEDALSAARAGVEEGMVAGGGSVLIHSMPALDKVEVLGDELIGVNILRRALEEPLRQIAINAGQEGSVVVEAVRKLKPGQRLRRAARRVRRPVRVGRDRSGQGDPIGAGERGERLRPAAHHRDGHHRSPREGEGDAGHAARRREWTSSPALSHRCEGPGFGRGLRRVRGRQKRHARRASDPSTLAGIKRDHAREGSQMPGHLRRRSLVLTLTLLIGAAVAPQSASAAAPAMATAIIAGGLVDPVGRGLRAGRHHAGHRARRVACACTRAVPSARR